jgi:hypothetical protein
MFAPTRTAFLRIFPHVILIAGPALFAVAVVAVVHPAQHMRLHIRDAQLRARVIGETDWIGSIRCIGA